MAKKLTARQLQVVEKLKEGWELGAGNVGNNFRAWMQKNGLGKGGPTIEVHTSTFTGLLHRNIIEQKKHSFPSSLYGLRQSEKT